MVGRFSQVDVFTTEPYRANPVAVVHDPAGIDDEAMLRIANWTNLSETTYLLAPSPAADYRLRTFTPVEAGIIVPCRRPPLPTGRHACSRHRRCI